MVLWRDDDDDRQPDLFREGKVALVAGRHAHDGAGAVFVDDVVAEIDRHLGAVDRIDRISAGEDAFFFCFGGGALDLAHFHGLFNEGAHGWRFFLAGDELFHEGMLRREHHVGDAVEGIWSGGEDLEFVALLGGEGDHRAFGAADPVFLHDLDLVWPAFELVEIVQQTLGVVGDLEEPLIEGFLFHNAVAALALAVDNLLVGEHCGAAWAPVDGGVFLVGEAVFIKLQEDPLRPFVIIRQTGRDLAVPVKAEAQRLELALHVGDVFLGPFCRRDAVLDGCVFSWQTEGVPAHWMQHVVAMHGFETRDDIPDGIVAHMAHMEIARWIWKHFQAVVVWFFCVVGTVHVVRCPLLLPF